jgi:hypothetical protein
MSWGELLLVFGAGMMVGVALMAWLADGLLRSQWDDCQKMLDFHDPPERW